MAGNVAVIVMIPQIGEKDGRIWAAKKEIRNVLSVLFFIHKAAKNKIPVRIRNKNRTGKERL